MTLALQASGITKRFPGVLANDHVGFDLEKGEIHALLGENGAGKSTLMNILYGLYQPDEGEIRIADRPTRITSPHDAIAQGIGMVHQHFMLVPPLTVTENIMLGQESVTSATKALGGLSVLDRRTVAARVRELSREYGLDVDPDAYVRDLTVGSQQRIEIIKALYRSADILILDEPTAVLTPQEADELFVIMRALVKQGKSIVFITHKLREVFAVADRISVMRDGQMVGTVKPAEATSELTEALTGLRRVAEGRVTILGHDTTHVTPRQVVEVGVAHVPEDRHKHGLVLAFPVRDNLVLCSYYRSPFAKGIELDFPVIEQQAEELVNTFDIRTPSIQTSAGSLSGGNQQKVIVARELARPVKLLIASQPTRGLDVGSIEFIHQRIVEARDKGTAVLLISAELDEIMSLSDRIAVMYKGHILDTLDAQAATREQLGLLMAGVVKEGAHV
jgi:ABC-type uncharacterized transport system ATPase subunit